MRVIIRRVEVVHSAEMKPAGGTRPERRAAGAIRCDVWLLLERGIALRTVQG